MIYCDHNATVPLRPEARDAYLAAADTGGNASSVHQVGRGARRIVERSRQVIGSAIGSRADDVIFTSGATEALRLAIGSLAAASSDVVVLVSALEHAAVLDNIRALGLSTVFVDVKANGVIDLDDLKSRIEEVETSLPVLALMAVNNETGVIQPVAEAAAIVRAQGGLTICDAVQAMGKTPINVGLLGVDYLALSAHKVGGPQGVGALWVRAGAPIQPVQSGGGQERSLRSGTENVPGIAGFAAALEAVTVSEQAQIEAERNVFEATVQTNRSTVIAGQNADRVNNTSCIALEGFGSETQVMAMDLAGFAVSAGSACSSGKVRRSSVLDAMGYPPSISECALRLSFGWKTKPGDGRRAAEAWLRAAARVVPVSEKEAV